MYGEAYSSLSLSALSGRAIRAAVIKDVLVTAGLNVGAASSGAGPLALLPGATLDFDIPGFTVASVATRRARRHRRGLRRAHDRTWPVRHGRRFDRPHRLFIGFELEVWLSKYGVDGLDEYVPRSLVAWRF